MIRRTPSGTPVMGEKWTVARDRHPMNGQAWVALAPLLSRQEVTDFRFRFVVRFPTWREAMDRCLKGGN